MRTTAELKVDKCSADHLFKNSPTASPTWSWMTKETVGAFEAKTHVEALLGSCGKGKAVTMPPEQFIRSAVEKYRAWKSQRAIEDFSDVVPEDSEQIVRQTAYDRANRIVDD